MNELRVKRFLGFLGAGKRVEILVIGNDMFNYVEKH